MCFSPIHREMQNRYPTESCCHCVMNLAVFLQNSNKALTPIVMAFRWEAKVGHAGKANWTGIFLIVANTRVLSLHFQWGLHSSPAKESKNLDLELIGVRTAESKFLFLGHSIFMLRYLIKAGKADWVRLLQPAMLSQSKFQMHI